MKEISVEELKRLSDEEYVLIDIRDEGSIIYGGIQGAINIPAPRFLERKDNTYSFTFFDYGFFVNF